MMNMQISTDKFFYTWHSNNWTPTPRSLFKNSMVCPIDLNPQRPHPLFPHLVHLWHSIFIKFCHLLHGFLLEIATCLVVAYVYFIFYNIYEKKRNEKKMFNFFLCLFILFLVAMAQVNYARQSMRGWRTGSTGPKDYARVRDRQRVNYVDWC